MSFAIWNWLEKYAKWRDQFLEEYPEEQLIPPTGNGDPLITWGENGKKVGILLAVGLVLLALSRTD